MTNQAGGGKRQCFQSIEIAKFRRDCGGDKVVVTKIKVVKVMQRENGTFGIHNCRRQVIKGKV